MPDPCATPSALLRELYDAGSPDACIAEALNAVFPHRAWNRQQVWRLRRKLGLPSRRPPRRLLADYRRDTWRVLQFAAGFGHLLPAPPEGRAVGPWSPGHELTPRQTRVLQLLRQGPRTARQLAQGLGIGRGRWSMRTLYYRTLRPLAGAGLVAASRGRGGCYEITPLALPLKREREEG